MICIIALVVFGILGIFSAKYRTIAKEAFDCVFRRLTLRKCTTGLDKRLKSQITGKFMRKRPKLGKFLYRHFEAISWAFTIVLIVSLGYSIYSVGNLFIYGNCNGPIPDAFCVFDPFISGGHGGECTIEGPVGEIMGVLEVHPHDPSVGPEDAKVTIIEAGCFVCPYTKQAVPVVKQIISHYGDSIRFVYKDFPMSSTHPGAQEAAEASHCAHEQGKYWEYHDVLFENQGKTNFEDLLGFAKDLDLNTTQFSECLTSHKYKSQVDGDFAEAFAIGVYGTPTFFINDQVVVGPKTFNEFKQIIDSELARG
ncbi:MAG: thioredoxin domain-containing protein [Candidatus Aenigmatarchaeota archaeon]|nr:MAG: thioredoxin domain-containing protein [Candidatus Aenigmarchaeota archaeon]